MDRQMETSHPAGFLQGAATPPHSCIFWELQGLPRVTCISEDITFI